MTCKMQFTERLLAQQFGGDVVGVGDLLAERAVGALKAIAEIGWVAVGVVNTRTLPIRAPNCKSQFGRAGANRPPLPKLPKLPI
jgi:hypothetical protein